MTAAVTVASVPKKKDRGGPWLSLLAWVVGILFVSMLSSLIMAWRDRSSSTSSSSGERDLASRDATNRDAS